MSKNSSGNSKKISTKESSVNGKDVGVSDSKSKKASWKTKYEDLMKLWERVPENVRYFVERYGTPFRVIRRDYNPYLGVLLGYEFKLETLDLGVESEDRIYTEKKIVREQKIVRIGTNSIIAWESLIDMTEEPFPEES